MPKGHAEITAFGHPRADTAQAGVRKRVPRTQAADQMARIAEDRLQRIRCLRI